MALHEQARQVAAPITAHPTQTLAEILGPIFQCRPHLALFVILHLDLPVMRVQPSRDEVVVIRIELHRPPLLVCETMREGLVLQNVTAVRHRSP